MIPGELQTSPLPTVRVSGNNPVEAINQDYDKPIEQGNKIATEETDKVNTATTSEAYAHLVQLKNDLTYGENGVLTKKGKDAFNLGATYAPAWQQGVKDVTSNLTDQQKLMLAPAIKNEGVEFNSLVAGHEHSERQNYAVSSSQFLQKNLTADAIRNYNVAPNKVPQAIRSAQAENNVLKPLLGWSDQELQDKNREIGDTVHSGIINQLRAEGQYGEAEKYLNNVQHVMDPKTVDSLRSGLADTNLPFQQAFNAIDKSNGQAPVPAQVYDRLTPGQKQAIDETKALKANNQAATTDPGIHQMLLDWAQSAETDPTLRHTFLRQNMDLYYSKLDPQDLAQIKQIQAGFTARGGEGKKVAAQTSETSKLINVALDPILGKSGPDNKEERDKFAEQVMEWSENYKIDHDGNYPTLQEKKQYIAEQTKQGIVAGSGLFGTGLFKDTKPAFELAPGEKFEDQPTPEKPTTPVNHIQNESMQNRGPSAKEKRDIAIELAQHGKAVSDKNVEILWKRKHGG